MRRTAVLVLVALLSGCGFMTDPGTRLDFALERAIGSLGAKDGDRYTYEHHEPTGNGQCAGAYRVQIDKVGFLVVWCLDANGKTTASGSTSHHANYMESADTFIVEKAAGQPMYVEFERRNGKAVIVGVR